jgi:tRNA pseudouridine55 synthase
LAAQEPLCGILNVDKPLEWTSHQVVAAVRKWSRQRRIGHAGTLDPLATGVLLLCMGKATRVSPYLMASTKVYRTTLRLGLSTTTHDAEGEVVAQCEADVSREQFESVLPRFLGQIDQVPPVYSAVKRQGKRLYEYARQGVEVQVPPRTVEIHSLSTVDWTPPQVTLDVACGPGTYVRALARDLGRALGCGASLVDLRRTQSGQFRAEQAVPLSAIEQAYASASANAAAEAGDGVRALIRAHLHSLDLAFAHLPSLILDADKARLLTMGQGVEAETQETRGLGLVPADGHSRTYDDARTHDYARAYGPGKQFLALVAWHEDTNRWHPRKVFTQPSELL